MEYVEKKYIVLVEYGDPVTNEKLSTSWGFFETQEDARFFIESHYKGKNHICSITPLNNPTVLGDTNEV